MVERIRNWFKVSFTLPLIMLGVLLIIFWQGGMWYRTHLLAVEKARLEGSLTIYGNVLTATLNQRLAIVKGLEAFARSHQDKTILEGHFHSFVSGLYSSARGIRTIQVFPPDTPALVYPLEENEAVIEQTLTGLINNEGLQVHADVQRALLTRQVTLSEPYKLRQGVLEMMVLQAIYQGDSLWGCVLVTLDISQLLADTGLSSATPGLIIALRSGSTQLLSGDGSVFAGSPVLYRVEIPEGYWELAAIPENGWSDAIRTQWNFYLAGASALIFFLVFIAYRIGSYQQHLKIAVDQRTADLARELNERERAEAEVLQLNRLYQVLSQVNQQVLRATTHSELFHNVCRIAVEIGQFRLAWIGWVEAGEQVIKAVSQVGDDTGLIAQLVIPLDDPAGKSGPLCSALQTGSAYISVDLENTLWKDAAAQMGIGAIGSFPLRVGGVVRGALNVYVAQRDYFRFKEINLLQEVADDVSFALDHQEQEALRQRAEIERQRAAQTLAKSERRYRLAQQAAHIGSWEWDILADQLYWSDEMYQIFDRDPQCFIPTNQDVIDSILPEDKPRAVMAVERSLSEGVPFDVEYRIADRRGQIKWLEAKGEVAFSDQGQPVSAAGTIQDISLRKQAEARQRLQAAALESAANAILITDRQGTIQWINPAYTQLTGYAAQEVVGQNPRILKSGVQDQAFYENLWDTILSGHVWRGELVNKRKDGSLYSEEATITPLSDSAGTITHFIGVKQDITERKRTEVTLRRKTYLQEKMASLGRDLASTLDLQRIYRFAECYLKQMIDCPNFGITLFDARQQILKPAYLTSDGVLVDLSTIPPLKYNPRAFSNGRSKAIATKVPLIVCDLEAKRKASGGMLVGSGQEPQSAFYIPILVVDEVIGLLEIQSYQADAYQQEDGEWLSVVANQIGLAIQNAHLFAQTQQRLAELQVLNTIGQVITSSTDPSQVYQSILEQVTMQAQVDAADILIYDPQVDMLAYVGGRGFLTPIVENTRLRLGEGLAGKAALQKHRVELLNPASDFPGYLRGALWEKEGFAAYLGLPLIFYGEIKGVLEIFSRKPILPEPDWLRFMEMLAQQVAIAIDSIQIVQGLTRANLELTQAYDATIAGWSRAMDLRDKETEGHTARVTQMTLQVAQALGLSQDKMAHIRRGALLHDIGKLGVPDHILNKPGPLTDEEWQIMMKHPEFAYEMLSAVDYLRPALEIPYCHHEKWDGTGYPRQLKGQQIPLEARIFALVDVWDALSSDRPYRLAWPQEKVLAYIKEQSGKHFDPKVTAAFLVLVEKLKS